MTTYQVWVKRTQELCQTITAETEADAIATAQELGEWNQVNGTEEEFNAIEEVCEDCANDTDTPCTSCLWEESVK